MVSPNAIRNQATKAARKARAVSHALAEQAADLLDLTADAYQDAVLIEKAADGDADAAKRGAADLTMQVQNYLARFPG